MNVREILSMVFGESAEMLTCGEKLAVIDGKYTVVDGRERLAAILAAAGVTAVAVVPHRETKGGLVPPAVNISTASGIFQCTVWVTAGETPAVSRLGKDSGVSYPTQLALAATLTEALSETLAEMAAEFLQLSDGRSSADVLRDSAAARRAEAGGETGPAPAAAGAARI